MLITVLKPREEPKIIQYRSYKNFNNQVFQREVNSELLIIDLNKFNLSDLSEIFLAILDNYAPKRKVYSSK